MPDHRTISFLALYVFLERRTTLQVLLGASTYHGEKSGAPHRSFAKPTLPRDRLKALISEKKLLPSSHRGCVTPPV